MLAEEATPASQNIARYGNSTKVIPQQNIDWIETETKESNAVLPCLIQLDLGRF